MEDFIIHFRKKESKKQTIRSTSMLKTDRVFRTVCPGSSEPPGKIFNVFASETEVYTIYITIL